MRNLVGFQMTDIQKDNTYLGIFLTFLGIVALIAFGIIALQQRECSDKAIEMGGAPLNLPHVGCIVVMPDGTLKKP